MSLEYRPLIYHYSKNIDKRPFVFIFLSTLGLKFKEMFRNLCWGLTLLSIAFQGVAFANSTDRTGVGEEGRETIIGLRYGMGKLLPHGQELHYLEARRFQSFEVSFMRRGRGEEPWHNTLQLSVAGLYSILYSWGNTQTGLSDHRSNGCGIPSY
jgi:hypothetical protein